ncbi:Serine palmitoyltransferase 2 [Schistosoma japonicum]|uniref:serine C-palmitoyltransferase n=1 Tax=Schistosoma japonicum TaxID=6182 RepID=A0A4Z2DW01_SCHJA|nr:Serine palmitoyltransferase 2 [Schistosoma japonicum]TNN20411.1 Serine palmitoyltransferase 2 [Schistosoma japonicum]TNN20412.1 Serine palmitoyltransferase 2 [Schistosoma japonicum]TNN20413.1 Serine palmitoyltransferase 2 [Schistosoma japonicum]
MRKFQCPRTGEAFYESFEEAPLFTAVLTYMSFLILNILGRLQDFLRFFHVLKNHAVMEPSRTKSFVPLYSSYEAFYTRNLYRRVQDCWNRPICSAPGSEIVVMDRKSPDCGWTLNLTGTTSKVLNLGSYNYLGFGDPIGPCTDATEKMTRKFGVGVASSRQEAGSLVLHKELEDLVAEFVGQEAAIVFSMGFSTNSLNLPCLVDKECCVVSDELNHTSLVLGCRLTGATVRRFKHNDMDDLERVLQDCVVFGRPRTHRPYKKILVVVEGIYSMEGSILHLPEVIALKKKYKAYLYLDEAHSIGALGQMGRGVADYFGVDPRDIDVSMGTFTKSFGSCGGYLAGNQKLIDYLRSVSYNVVYGGSMSAPIAQQIISAMRIVMGKDVPCEGERRLKCLAENIRYFRARLHEMRLIVYGNRDSPVVPIIVYMPAKLAAFSRRCLELGLGTVVVGFPATTLLLSRVRFCISSSHTRELLDRALSIIDQVAEELGLRYSKQAIPEWAKEVLFKDKTHHYVNGFLRSIKPSVNLPSQSTFIKSLSDSKTVKKRYLKRDTNEKCGIITHF